MGRPLPGDPHPVVQRLVRVRAVGLLTQIRRVIYSTNVIESLNARFRRATRARGHFPNQQELKCLYMVVSSLDPTGTGQERWMNRWKPALNAFAITFEGRLF